MLGLGSLKFSYKLEAVATDLHLSSTCMCTPVVESVSRLAIAIPGL